MEIFYPYSWWKKINLAASAINLIPDRIIQLIPIGINQRDSLLETNADIVFVFI